MSALEKFEKAITSAKNDPYGGKVLLDIELANKIYESLSIYQTGKVGSFEVDEWNEVNRNGS